ncbi:MAG: hypothetical protein RI909_904 [Bacteroidota bacterium]
MLMAALILLSLTLIILLIWMVTRSRAAARRIESQKNKIAQLEQLHEKSRNDNAALVSEKQHLFSIVSHDLKGPFNRIFALTQLIQSASDNLQPDQKEYLAKMHIMIADGLAMIRNLTDSQKLEGKGIDFNPEAFNLSTLLGTLVKNYKITAERKKVQLHIEMPPSMTVHTDRYSLNRILDNLLSNAVKFSGENKNIFVIAKDEGADVTIDVRDEGPGISEEDQGRLYKKFQTITARPTAGETNSGIGLYVAKNLADKLNVKLSCVSKMDGGTVFTLKISKQ